MTKLPTSLLVDENHTEVIKNPIVNIEPQHFSTRRKAAEYLTKAFAPWSSQQVTENAGMWTWLSLFYFDEVCPLVDGQRRVKKDYSYIFEPNNPRRFYFHHLFIGWYVLRVSANYNRLFLEGPLSSMDKLTSEVFNRLYLTRIPCIFEVLDRLYWDDRLGRARIGITQTATIKPGDLVHRFPIRMRQLEKTYDLQSLRADQLIELLGTEFHFDEA